MKLIVTQKHINAAEATRHSWPPCYHCPLARALADHLKVDQAEVNFQTARAAGRKFAVSKPMRRFINDFDTGKLVEPGTFILKELPADPMKF